MRRMERIFAWLGGLTFILLCLVVAAIFAFRAAAIPYLENHIFITHNSDTQTPETFGVPYKAITITSHGRVLDAWTVDAGSNTPAILLFGGNGQTVHDWAKVQAYLFQQHVSSMVFDYSGFGKSTGTPTVQHLNQDAMSAWRVFVGWAGPQRPKFVVAYSLGTAIALNNASDFQPKPAGIAIYGAFNSARDLMVYIRALPAWLAPLVPDVWDNVSAAARLREPLLVVAGTNDTNVPPLMSRQVALYANDGGPFVLIPGASHGGIVGKHMKEVWAAILDFVRQGAGGSTESGK